MLGFIGAIKGIVLPGLVAGLSASFAVVGPERTLIAIYNAIRKSVNKLRLFTRAKHDDYQDALIEAISPPLIKDDGTISFSVRYGDGSIRSLILKQLSDTQVILYDSQKNLPVYINASSTRTAAEDLIYKIYMGKNMTQIHRSFHRMERRLRTGESR